MNRATLDMAVGLVWSGFYGSDEIVEMVLEHCFLEDIPVNVNTLTRAVRDEIEDKLEDQQSWPAVTDCERLDRIFDELNNEGIIALSNVGFNETEALEEIHAVYVKRGGEFEGVRGYCFYHADDVERAVSGQGLYLSYGASDAEPEKSVRVGALIRERLRAAGLSVEWNGTLGKRLQVYPLQWQRRALT